MNLTTNNGKTIKFVDIDATYYLNGSHVEVILRGDAQQTIYATSFVAAKAALKDRIARQRAAEIEAAWSAK